MAGIDVLVPGGQLQEGQLAGQGCIGQRRLDLDTQLVAVGDVQVEAFGEAETEAEVEIPVQVDVEVAFGLEPDGGQAQVEADAGIDEVDRLAELEIPAHEELVLRRAGRVDVGGQPDVCDAGRRPAAVLLEQDAQPARAQQLEQLARDEVLVRVAAVLDLGAEVLDEAFAEVFDEAGTVGELVAHQGQRHAEDLAVENVLQPFQEEVDAIDDQQHVIEQTEVRRVQGEQIRRHHHAEARRVGEVTAQGDVAPVVGLVREVHRQRGIDRAAEVDVHVRTELHIRQQHPARGEDGRIQARTECGADAGRAVLDGQPEPAQGSDEGQVVAGGRQRPRDAGVIKDVDGRRAGQVETEGQVDGERAAGLQPRRSRQVVAESGNGEVHRQRFGEALVDTQVDPQDVQVVTGVARRAAVITHQGQADQVAVRRDAEGFLELVFQELQRARRVVARRLDGGIEPVCVAQQVVDRDVDERDGLIQEAEGFEFTQEFGQRNEAVEDGAEVEVEVVERNQFAQVREAEGEVGRLAGKRVADVEQVDFHPRVGAEVDPRDRGVERDVEHEAAGAGGGRRLDQGVEVVEVLEQFGESDAAVQRDGARILQAQADAAVQVGVAGQVDADEAELGPGGHARGCGQVEIGADQRVLDEEAV